MRRLNPSTPQTPNKAGAMTPAAGDPCPQRCAFTPSPALQVDWSMLTDPSIAPRGLKAHMRLLQQPPPNLSSTP